MKLPLFSSQTLDYCKYFNPHLESNHITVCSNIYKTDICRKNFLKNGDRVMENKSLWWINEELQKLRYISLNVKK